MTVLPVAGCLFEVHLPQEPAGEGWTWARGTDAVTLLTVVPGRFRFRAERAGQVVLHFESPAAGGPPAVVRVPVAIAPEDG